jgi:hypothetical protein
MELSWGALALIIVAAAVAWFWQDSLGARERANAAATQACQDLGLQFLDGTVAFARIALARSGQGRLTFRRTYVFDYTANSIERRQGFVVLIDRRIESVGYAPDAPVRPAAPNVPLADPPRRDAADAGNGSSRVLVLDDWRARRRPSDEKPGERSDARDDQRS